MLLAIKEAVAFIGVLTIEEEGRLTVMKALPKLPNIAIQIAITHGNDDAKLLRIILGK